MQWKREVRRAAEKALFCLATWQAHRGDGFSAQYPLWPCPSKALESKVGVEQVLACFAGLGPEC